MTVVTRIDAYKPEEDHANTIATRTQRTDMRSEPF